MLTFIASFILLYGGMHVYAFMRLCQTFTPDKAATALLSAWMLLMTITPLLVRLSEKSHLDRVALILSWPGYIWMGSLFIFCTILFAIDSIRIISWIGNQQHGLATPFFLSASYGCKAALLLAVITSGYALYEARGVRTEYLTVRSAKLPVDSPPVRIVQITDVHLGLLFRETRLESLLQAVRAARPDILVSTGDLVDGRLSREDVPGHLTQMAAMIAAVPTPSGKYAALGNHEYYAGLDQALKFTAEAGFTVLRNQSVSLAKGITITGIDDPARRRLGLPDTSSAEPVLLNTAPKKTFQLLLKHRPSVPVSSDGLFDLQLSGHVHKGQIFPFNLLVRLQYPIPCGTSVTAGNSTVHVSRGSGTWGPPMRLCAPPEVTVINIVPAK